MLIMDLHSDNNHTDNTNTNNNYVIPIGHPGLPDFADSGDLNVSPAESDPETCEVPVEEMSGDDESGDITINDTNSKKPPIAKKVITDTDNDEYLPPTPSDPNLSQNELEEEENLEESEDDEESLDEEGESEEESHKKLQKRRLTNNVDLSNDETVDDGYSMYGLRRSHRKRNYRTDINDQESDDENDDSTFRKRRKKNISDEEYLEENEQVSGADI
ncbi:sarcoplasmic reticulum histidine-rich calcium-binding protein-like [Gordionus sp. m RMFG-2023]|uniref:sarcoplasmic reticulum histidine-rich calcium-binding protein-like n=1 Tax=Gordionus sp. m RMFG-2023 TaxID=3053472 RepID=UPI0031FBD3D2